MDRGDRLPVPDQSQRGPNQASLPHEEKDEITNTSAHSERNNRDGTIANLAVQQQQQQHLYMHLLQRQQEQQQYESQQQNIHMQLLQQQQESQEHNHLLEQLFLQHHQQQQLQHLQGQWDARAMSVCSSTLAAATTETPVQQYDAAVASLLLQLSQQPPPSYSNASTATTQPILVQQQQQQQEQQDANDIVSRVALFSSFLSPSPQLVQQPATYVPTTLTTMSFPVIGSTMDPERQMALPQQQQHSALACNNADGNRWNNSSTGTNIAPASAIVVASSALAVSLPMNNTRNRDNDRTSSGIRSSALLEPVTSLEDPWSARSAALLGSLALTQQAADAALDPTNQTKSRKLVRPAKPKDLPKRPLSAYNVFFQEERQRILNDIPKADNINDSAKRFNTARDTGGEKEDGDDSDCNEIKSSKKARKRKTTPHGKIGFETLAKTIGNRWQALEADQVGYYQEKSDADKERYRKEMKLYRHKQATILAAEEGHGGTAPELRMKNSATSR